PDGVHTITWSYERDCCWQILWGQLDAVWIDSVEIVPAAPTIASESFPPGCVMPPGWIAPAGSAAGWNVAFDSAGEGVCSLKSGPVSETNTSQIQFAGYFNEGTIAFDRRAAGDLYFFLDGVQVDQSFGGNSWVTFSVPVSAGSHTVRWSYQRGWDSN